MKTTTTTVSAIAMMLSAPDASTAFAPLQPTVQKSTRISNSLGHTRDSAFLTPLHMNEDKHESLEAMSEVSNINGIAVEKRPSTDPTPFFVDVFKKTLGDDNLTTKNNQSMRFVAAAFAMALTLAPLPSDAAMSGGRIGGSYSRPMQSRSMRSSPSSYSRGYSSGYSSGYYSRPSVAITPGIGFGYSPFYSPFRPTFPGYYGGGAISYARGPSFFDLVFFGGLFVAATNFLQNKSREGDVSTFNGFGSSTTTSSALGSGTSVVQVSVALDVPNRDDPSSILSVLNKLSATAKTDNRVGIQNLTSQVALELLRRRSSIISASAKSQHYRDSSKAEREYERKAIQERSKFEKETISRYGGVDYSMKDSTLLSPSTGVDGKATKAVVTIVMAIDGDSTKVPNVNSISDVEEALRRISSDSKVDDCLQSVEILWTPEDRTESLSLRDVVADYPELRSV